MKFFDNTTLFDAISCGGGFSAKWYLREGTIVRDWKGIIESSNDGIVIWAKVSRNATYFRGVFDTRRLNRKLRKMLLEN